MPGIGKVEINESQDNGEVMCHPVPTVCYTSSPKMNMDEVGDAIPEGSGPEPPSKPAEVGDAPLLPLSSPHQVTEDQCSELASRLAGHWRKLAPKLGIGEERLVQIEAEVGDPVYS